MFSKQGTVTRAFFKSLGKEPECFHNESNK